MKGALAMWALAALAPVAAAAERAPEVQVYPSLARPDFAVVHGRVLRKSGERAGGRIAKNLSRLLANDEWKGAPVRVAVHEHAVEVVADEEGMFEATFRLDADPLDAGEHVVRAQAPGVRGEGPLFVVGPAQTVVVSDLDDTVVITQVASTRRMVASAIALDEATQPAVPGMAEFYQCLADAGAAFAYLSGSPVQFLGRIEALLASRGFPPGAIALRKVGPSLDPAGFKLPRLQALLLTFPESRFVFVGDSGEKDPEVYAKAGAPVAKRIARTYIRLATEERADSPRFEGALAFRRARQAAEDAAARGLIPPECAARVPGAGGP